VHYYKDCNNKNSDNKTALDAKRSRARVWRTLLRCVLGMRCYAGKRREGGERRGSSGGGGGEWGNAIVGIYYCQKNLVGQN